MNPIVVTLASIATGAAAGAAVATAGVIGAWMLLEQGINTFGDPRNSVFAATALGLVVAVVLGWTLTRGLAETWRRGVAAVLAAFGCVMLGAAAMPLSMFFPRPLTFAYLALLAVAAFFTARLARKHGVSAAVSPPL